LNDPFWLEQERIDKLTDREAYDLYFRKYDKESEAAEEIDRMNAEGEAKTLEQRKAEFIEMCQSFGHSLQAAEQQWQEWLKEQG
jgi:hypothetical protein